MSSEYLCGQAYEHNPRLWRFCQESGLPLRSHAEFKTADLDAMQERPRLLAEQIWNPDRLEAEPSS